MPRKKSEDQCTLTDADMTKIGSMIESKVGNDVRIIKSSLDGSPPTYEDGIRVQTLLNTKWRTKTSGALLIINLLVLVLGGFALYKVNDVLTFIAVEKAKQQEHSQTR